MLRRHLAILLALLAVAAAPQRLPPIAILDYVTDAAKIVDARRETWLTSKLADFEARTRHQLVVVTVPTLSGERIERYSLALANRAGIGRAGYNDGVMILVAPTERQVRIEVGRGLERALPDAFCAAVIRQRMIPRLRSGDFGGGIDVGVTAIVERLTPRVAPQAASVIPANAGRRVR